MSRPLSELQDNAGAEWVEFGDSAAGSSVNVVQTFGEYEAEYAAIRKGAGIMHAPHRAVLRVSGEDRRDFLHRFLTNDTNGLKPGMIRRAFLLNNKGRIEADLILIERDDHTLVQLDRHLAEPIRETLDKFLFAEDVQLSNEMDGWECLAVHGPAASALLEAAGKAGTSDMNEGEARSIEIAGSQVVVYRRDETGSPGMHLLVPSADVQAVYEALLQPVGGIVPEVEGGVRRAVTGRGIGWLAYNTARIEGGTALYFVDFGPDSLPAEAGPRTMQEAVSFTKGCYLGQEIVARMHSRGRPKRILVGLRFEDDKLPIAGSQVFAIEKNDNATAESTGDVVGGIASSTISPMLGNVAIALAVVKWGQHQPGTKLLVPAEGEMVRATVADTTRFIP